ncbi:MAG: HEAT repeat domain-containing protein [Clostridiaceae bacterium]|nr:HEAT repeat domain-containing protein [Clostridiaceae bacterium]
MLFADKSTKIAQYIQKKNSAKLVLLLKDSKPEIRMQAIKALGSVGDDKAINALITLLADPDKNVRLEAIKSMGSTGNQTVRSHLQHLIQIEPDETLKQAIRDAIAKIPNKDYAQVKTIV